jgi:hypothetical protein
MRNIVPVVVCVGFCQPIWAQTQREVRPYEALLNVPSVITQIVDQGNIYVFLQDREQINEGFREAVTAHCPRLLSNEISSIDFAEILDEEDERYDAAIVAAYDRMVARLSDTGRAQLQEHNDNVRGYTIDLKSTDVYLRYPEQLDRQFRYRCEHGFTAQQDGAGVNQNDPPAPTERGGPNHHPNRR